jgi:NodT family efflux transporter outer membrane factor (OMF) lipoprotein
LYKVELKQIVQKIQIFIPFFLFAFFCSCGLRPSPPVLRQAPVEALSKAQAFALNGQAIASDEWPEDEWWRIFEDGQLNGLVDQALCLNPRMRAAEARVQIAAAQFRKERASLFPNFNAQGDYTRYRQSKNGIFGLFPGFPLSYTQPEISINFSYEFDFWKKHTNLIIAAIDETQARAAEAYLTNLILAVSVSDAYFRLQIASARQEIARELIRNRQELIELTLLRRQHALDNDWDVNRARTAMLIADQFYEEVTEDVITSNNELQALLAGDFLTEVIPVDVSVGLNEPFPIPKTLALDLLAHRADVWARKWWVLAAARLVSVARADYYPNINLTGFFGLQSIFPSKLFQWHSIYGMIGPAFHLPLFDGGLLDAALDTKQQEYCLAVAEYDESVLEAVKEVLNALEILKVSQELYLIAREGEKVARESLELAKLRVQQNLNSRLDVLSYENDWLAAKDIYLNALLNSLEARLTLIRALGGGAGMNHD